MAIQRRTWRNAGGERIEGTWRHAFIRNDGTYFLTDLLIYADGMVDCWGLQTLESFADKLASGRVATDLPEGALASADQLASWRFAEPKAWLTSEMLLAVIRDDIDDLNGRSDSTGRCLAAVDAFLNQPTEANRAIVREAYEAIPEHLRIYALRDMDRKDFPLRVIATGPGNHIELWSGNTVDVTEEMHASALEYFAERKQYKPKTPADGPAEPVESSVYLTVVILSGDWPQDPGALVLRNEFPAPIVIGNRTYPTVMHAYWALAVADEQRQAEILGADKPYDAQKLAEDSTLHDNWPQLRAAVMLRLLRAKFQQHPEYAETLMATGATRLIYSDLHSRFWGDWGPEGRNWMGRLLELVRSELIAATAEIPW